MEGVEHLGKYVYEMTQAKIRAIREGGGVLPAVEEERMEVDGEDGEGLLEEEEPEEDEEVIG